MKITLQHLTGALFAITIFSWFKLAYWHFAGDDSLVGYWIGAFVTPITIIIVSTIADGL